MAEQRTILVADDEPTVRMLVTSTLEDARTTLLEAADGCRALELARLHEPDLVVLDLMMPCMTGLEVLAALRADRAGRRARVIVLTASGIARDEELALAAGADLFLRKPFSPLDLLQRVDAAFARSSG